MISHMDTSLIQIHTVEDQATAGPEQPDQSPMPIQVGGRCVAHHLVVKDDPDGLLEYLSGLVHRPDEVIPSLHGLPVIDLEEVTNQEQDPLRVLDLVANGDEVHHHVGDPLMLGWLFFRSFQQLTLWHGRSPLG